MPHFHPSTPPHFLSERMRDAERAVWETLQKLDYSWHVFYSARENSGSGYDREVDFVLIRLNRIFYCEVKGGIVHVDQRAGPGVTWAHFTRSGEPIRKRADPKQLWMAKAALGETIRQITGQSPRDLGFREHNVYIFPHTPRHVAQGADLERDYIHYAFEEDIAALPIRLQQIVESSKGRFINRKRIESIIGSLKETVIREREGMLPHTRATPLPSYQNGQPAAARLIQRSVPFVVRAGRGFQQFRRRGFRLSRLLNITAAAVVLLAVLNAIGKFDTALVNQRREPVRQPNEPTASVSRPLPSASKSAGKNPNSALPPFIASASAGEVERAIAAAQDSAVYVSWQSGSEHGFVILRSEDGDGCRHYQISRNDVQPMKYDTVRRCP